MKTNNKNIALSALLAAFSLITLGLDSCVKDQFDESLGDLINISLTAENPGFGDVKTKTLSSDSTAVEGNIVYEDSSLFICAPQSMEPDTKTGMTSDGTPFWELDDKISLVTKDTKNNFVNYEFTSDLTKDHPLAKKTNFKGAVIPDGYTETYAFYPYNKGAVITGTDKDVSVTLTIPSNQTPKYASSFDGKADILVAKKITVPTTKDLDKSKLEFTRKVGFLKIGLFDKNYNSLNGNIVSLSVTAPDNINLVGPCQLNLNDGVLVAQSGHNNSVTVRCADDGTATVLMSIYPQTINKDTKLTFHCETVDAQGSRKTYNITKIISTEIVVEVNHFTFIGLIPAPSNEVGNISKNDAWLNFLESNLAMAEALKTGDMNEYNRILSERILLDYSYAGYEHGTAVPPPLEIPKSGNKTYKYNGYTVYNIANYLKTSPTISDRQAFLNALIDAGMVTYNDSKGKYVPVDCPNANCIFYFPERYIDAEKTSVKPYVLHNQDDDDPGKSLYRIDSKVMLEGYESNNKMSNPIVITAGNFIICGDGPGRTVLEMATRNNPTSKEFFSAKEMILIRNPKTDLEDRETGVISGTPLAKVNQDVVRGSMSVVVDKNASISSGQWVILALDSDIADSANSPLLKYELGEHSYDNTYLMMDNIGRHVKVRDYHQVDKYDPATGTLTFCEPIMREIKESRDGTWKIWSYNNYSGVGVENLTFLGHAPDKFVHHGGSNHDKDPWLMDGGFKPLTMSGLVNSWVRNVQFVSISECLRFKMCANCSAYNIEIAGHRGHAGISSAGSSRVFIGNVNDHSNGWPLENQEIKGTLEYGAGQYHACGVSKPSMGAVLWQNSWGKDATFESHSGQPRATLVDNCTGGWVEQRFGGDRKEIPNHLNDLTIWNMNATTYRSPTYGTEAFQWWYTGSDKVLWRVSPPIVVGFKGAPMDKTLSKPDKPGQMKYYEEGCGVPSLYKAQLEERAVREPNATLQEWRDVLDGLNKLPEWQYPAAN